MLFTWVKSGLMIAALCILTSAASAQATGGTGTAGGVRGGPPMTPGQKICEKEIGGTGAGAGCTVKVTVTANGACETGEAKFKIKVVITCPGETCNTYPVVEVCGDANEALEYTACYGVTFSVGPTGTTGDWNELMGPGGSCANNLDVSAV